ncbi:hypothetical protein RI367_006432 [Sorochytrium milnesiophthora]
MQQLLSLVALLYLCCAFSSIFSLPTNSTAVFQTGGGLLLSDSVAAALHARATTQFTQQTNGPAISVTLPKGCTAAQMRIRKEVRDLTPQEWSTFVAAVKNLQRRPANIPHYKGLTLYEQYSAIHVDNNSIKHNTPEFLPWHNQYLRQLENDLRVYNPSISLPYWSWDLDANAPEASSILTASYYGSSKAWDCIPNGPFTFASRVSDDNDFGPRTCVVRGFDPADQSQRLYDSSWLALLAQWAQSFSQFSVWLEVLAHSAVHNYIQGDMSTMASPNDPIFFAHHAFLDKVWRDFQAAHVYLYDGQEHMNEGLITRQPSLSDPLYPFIKSTGRPYTVADVWSNNGLCEYYMPPKKALAKRNSGATNAGTTRQLIRVDDDWAATMGIPPEHVDKAHALADMLDAHAKTLTKSGLGRLVQYKHAPVPADVVAHAQSH